MKSALFSPLSLRSVEFKNRVFISPMCQYSSTDGLPAPWHLPHLSSRAVGGAACVIQEATAVTPEGRISAADAGLWNDAQTRAWADIARAVKENGAVAGIQLAHAGRKASIQTPWEGDKPLTKESGAWPIVGPSEVPLAEGYQTPRALGTQEIKAIVDAFAASAKRAIAAGYEVVEIHSAHGYLLHSFLSPIANKRTDNYGGGLENRMRFTLEVAAAVRETWPKELPVFVRISATDWTEGGWDIDQSVTLAQSLKEKGIDLVDASSGGIAPHIRIPTGPGYQVPLAAAIRSRAGGIAVGAVGMITDAAQAEQIVATGLADVTLLARASLRDPYWPLHAAHTLGVETEWPKQYARAKPR